MSDKFSIFYNNNNKQLIQQAIILRIQHGHGVNIVNIDDGIDIKYLQINDINDQMINLKKLIEDDLKNKVSLYFLLCDENGSQLFVHELV